MTELEFWDSKPWLEAARILTAADEPLRALELLNNLPAYYRDYIPFDILDMKQKILAKMATPISYIKEDSEDLENLDKLYSAMKDTLRFTLLKRDLEEYNEKDITPHIIDLGPGDYWALRIFSRLKFKFTYSDIGLNSKRREIVYSETPSIHLGRKDFKQPVIFMACEIIEHLHHESDILIECLKHEPMPEIIHISTPKYTFDVRQTRKDFELFGDLGHLRAYTPKEFFKTVEKMFPLHLFHFYDSVILHGRGKLDLTLIKDPSK